MINAALSPRYVMQETPDVKAHDEVVHSLSNAEKIYKVAKVVAYMLGSLQFFVGSIFYYPKYSILWNGKGTLIGCWLYFFGCICFFIGANMDFIDTIRFNSGSAVRRVCNAYNGMTYVAAASIFVLGAVYFFPSFYARSSELGCWCFVIGSVLFVIGALVDIVFVGITHEDKHTKGFRWSNLKCWFTVSCLGTAIGALLFIIGSYYYLPKFTAQDDAQKSSDYMYLAINYYLIGSVFFTISASALIPDCRAALKAASVSKEGIERV